MEAGLREVCRSVRIGKILIQRVRSYKLVRKIWTLVFSAGRGDGKTKTILFKSMHHSMQCEKKKRLKLSKFPQDIAQRYVLLLDPMLGMCRVPIVIQFKVESHIMDSNGWIRDESC